MIRGLVGTLEKHHRVRILDEACQRAVRLSARYIPGRQLPDKAVSLIDTACARVAMSQAATPAPVEDRRRRIGLIDTELAILDREIAAGADHAARRAELADERTPVQRRTGGAGGPLGARSVRWPTRSPNRAPASKRRTRRRRRTRPCRAEPGGERSRRCRASSRWCFPWWTARRSPRSCRAGPASPPAACNRRDPHRAQPARGDDPARRRARTTRWRPWRRRSAPAAPG